MAFSIQQSMDFSVLFTNSMFLIGKKKPKNVLFNLLNLQNKQETRFLFFSLAVGGPQ